MKTVLSILFLFLCVSMNCKVAFGQTTYTWQGADAADWTVSTNWTPTRSTPASTDILQFNTGTTLTVTNVSTQTVGRFLLSNSTGITLQSAASVTLTAGNGSGYDLVIESGSSLTLGSSVNITLASSATADISGTLTVNSGMTFNTNGTSVLTTVNGQNGTISNAGTVSASALKFSVASGGKYQHARDGGIVPKATWNANSTCEITGVIATLPLQIKQQSFGNFTWNCPNQTMTGSSLGTDFATITYPIQGNFTMQNTGTGLCNFTSTAQDNYINGNFFMSGGILEITHTGGENRTVYVGGNFSKFYHKGIEMIYRNIHLFLRM